MEINLETKDKGQRTARRIEVLSIPQVGEWITYQNAYLPVVRVEHVLADAPEGYFSHKVTVYAGMGA